MDTYALQDFIRRFVTRHEENDLPTGLQMRVDLGGRGEEKR